MTDIVRRDIDIVVANKKTPERTEEILEIIPNTIETENTSSSILNSINVPSTNIGSHDDIGVMFKKQYINNFNSDKLYDIVDYEYSHKNQEKLKSFYIYSLHGLPQKTAIVNNPIFSNEAYFPTLIEQLPNIILISGSKRIYSTVNCKNDTLTTQYGNIFSLYTNGCDLYINLYPKETINLQGKTFSVNVRSSIDGSNKDLKLVFDDIYPLVKENERYSGYEMAYFSPKDSRSFLATDDDRKTGLCFLSAQDNASNSKSYSCWYDSKVYEGILENGGYIDHDTIIKIFKLESDNSTMTIKRFAIAQQIYTKSRALFNNENWDIKKIGLFEKIIGTIESFGYYEIPNSAIIMNVLEHIFLNTSRWPYIATYIQHGSVTSFL